MYESHFGLTSRPFRSKTEGAAVFVGPGHAETINGIHTGLQATDAVVTVTGPVGCGKTTIVNRALGSMSPGRLAAWVGRINVSAEEILELLLAGFGFARKTNSTLQRFAAFRRALNEQVARGVPVAIVVEDARKLGVAVLAEIEALTASDTADGGGASLVLMGEEGLDELLSHPDLARLKQRIRRRIRIRPLNEAEVGGYLRNGIREAGGRYDAVFGDGIPGIVAACSEGMPRMINTLAESALAAAADDGERVVSAARMHAVAAELFGYDGPQPAPVGAPEAAARCESETSREAAGPDWKPSPEAPVAPGNNTIPGTERELVVEFGRYPEEPAAGPGGTASLALPAEEARPGAETPFEILDNEPTLTDIPEIAFDQPALTGIAEIPDDEPTLTNIPEFINDTQPELKALPAGGVDGTATHGHDDAVRDERTGEDDADGRHAFDLDAVLSPDPDWTNLMPSISAELDEVVAGDGAGSPASPQADVAPDDLPTLSDSMRIDISREAETAGNRGGVDELPGSGDAGASAAGDDEEAQQCAADVDDVAAEAQDTAPVMSEPAGGDAEPASDLDALEAALEAARNGEFADAAVAAGSDGPAAADCVTPDGTAEITIGEALAEQQAQTRKLEEISASMDGVSCLEDMDDRMAETLFGEEFTELADAVVAAGRPIEPGSEDAEEPHAETGEPTALEASNDDSDGPIDDQVADDAVAGACTGEEELRESVALRIDLLKQMQEQRHAGHSEVVYPSEETPTASRRGPQPEPIERQINTSMTQTLEALKVAQVADQVAESKGAKKSGGLLSRFLRSS